MRKVLVTGGSGFIGSHCLSLLIERGFEIVALSRQVPPDARSEVRWLECDILQQQEVLGALRREKPSHLLHAAWLPVRGDVMSSADNAAYLDASLNLLTAFCENGGARAAIVGSCAEYDWSDGLCRAGITPYAPASVYGAAKNALRTRAETYAQECGLSLVWPRPFFLYGPGEHPTRLVRFVVDCLLNGRVADLSHGQQRRDYLYIVDAARGIVGALDSDTIGPLDIASGEAISIADLAHEIARQIGGAEFLNFGAKPTPLNEAPLVLGDPAPAFRAIGWRPRVNLADGLAMTISAARANP